MHRNDRQAFGEALTQLFAIYGIEMTQRLLDTWWGVLSPYRLDAVLAGINLYAGDITETSGGPRGHFRPTPADVKYQIEVKLAALIEARRNAIIADARERSAPYRELIARATTDFALNLISDDERQRQCQMAVREIDAIMGEEAVAQALAPQAAIRDEEAMVGSRTDRLPAMVRKALGWLGKARG